MIFVAHLFFLFFHHENPKAKCDVKSAFLGK